MVICVPVCLDFLQLPFVKLCLLLLLTNELCNCLLICLNDTAGKEKWVLQY